MFININIITINICLMDLQVVALLGQSLDRGLLVIYGRLKDTLRLVVPVLQLIVLCLQFNRLIGLVL